VDLIALARDATPEQVTIANRIIIATYEHIAQGQQISETWMPTVHAVCKAIAHALALIKPLEVQAVLFSLLAAQASSVACETSVPEAGGDRLTSQGKCDAVHQPSVRHLTQPAGFLMLPIDKVELPSALQQAVKLPREEEGSHITEPPGQIRLSSKSSKFQQTISSIVSLRGFAIMPTTTNFANVDAWIALASHVHGAVQIKDRKHISLEELQRAVNGLVMECCEGPPSPPPPPVVDNGKKPKTVYQATNFHTFTVKSSSIRLMILAGRMGFEVDFVKDVKSSIPSDPLEVHPTDREQTTPAPYSVPFRLGPHHSDVS
jgi:hypothetical protein